MKCEEARAWLVGLLNKRSYHGFCDGEAEALDMAISVLEKQIAKKPLIVNGEFDDAITFEWKDYLCPVCKCTLISKCDGEWCAGRKVAHCECGQAICWED